ncbi:MAG: cobalamin biosynthesis protein, partial [Cyanobacteria bacterium REEB498]|nr:cobalamin biosynthesis protein [Cyanobacteria bacterium REEB498]
MRCRQTGNGQDPRARCRASDRAGGQGPARDVQLAEDRLIGAAGLLPPLAPVARGLLVWGLVAAACGLDRLVGDPRWCPHPVVLMGWAISRLRRLAEAWAGDRPARLRLAGGLITAVLVGGGALVGWGVEQAAWRWPALGLPLLLLGLASALAGRSLHQAVTGVLARLGDATPGGEGLEAARTALAWIVGRDVAGLERGEILRAAAETASENAVDGLFAPLFWMLVGAALWCLAPAGVAPQGLGPLVPGPLLPGPLVPGPLALAWGFKAASTLDSMLGYRRGRLRWLGTAGARLDDGLTWLPCRLVALSLPLLGWRQGLPAG